MVIGQFFQVLCQWVVAISANTKLTSLASDQFHPSCIRIVPDFAQVLNNSFFIGSPDFLYSAIQRLQDIGYNGNLTTSEGKYFEILVPL